MKNATNNSATGKKTDDRKKTAGTDIRERFPLIVTILAVILLLVIATIILVNTVNSSLYSERKNYLGEITSASAKTVNESIENQMDKARIVKSVVQQSLIESEDAGSYMSKLETQLNAKEDKFFLVDSDGKYYCSDGHEGRIADRTYYTGKTDDEVKYLSTLPHLDTEKTYMIFRFRLDKPVTAMSDGNKVEIRYFAMMHDLEKLNKTVSSLFEGANNTFIYETDTGTMLYKQFGLGNLVGGYVIYPKFYAVDLINDEDPAELVTKCQNGETVVAEMKIDGTDYYFCSSNINVDNWSLAFVIQSNFLASSSGSSFNTVIYSIIIFAVLLSIAIIIVAGMMIKMRSERKEQEALAMASAAKSDFLFNMSHDIRTPMNAIIGFSDIAMKNIDDKERVMDSLRKTKLSGNLLLALINDILEFSRMESGNVKLNETGTDIVSMFDNMETVLSDMAAEKNIELTFEKGGIRDRYVLLDEVRCQRLLINVISNGIKYTANGGWVHVRMDQMSSSLGYEGIYRFIVEDNGIGMSEEFQEHLFEEFSREENSTTSGIQGTGLGLALVKAITDLMGGTVECVSRQGEGSKFTITLPLTIQADRGSEAKAIDTPVETISLDGFKALLVEDNELNSEIATDLLEDEGIVVDRAENGKAAIDILREKGMEEYDLILTDIQMPVMNGYELAEEINIFFPDRKIPLIALSANAFEEDKERSREAGMDDHIAKPIDVKELNGILGRYLSGGGKK